MPDAITMSYDNTDSQDTGDPENDELVMEDTGDFLQELLGGGTQLLSSVLGGNGRKPGQGIGAGIGALAGAGLGTLAGGAGAGIGAALGKAAGGAVENLVRTQTAKKKPVAKKPAPVKTPTQHPKRQRVPTKRERKILVEAEQKAKRTGQSGYAEEARLRVYRPADYKRKRDAGLLWSQVHEQNEFDDSESEFAESSEFDESETSYDDTAAPETRPQPRRHISTVPMTDEQMAALTRAVPQLRALDPRLLRTMSGSAGVARDVSGVDPTTGIYHALPGETPHGITKKLTGQVERAQELLAANPGKTNTAKEWNIPPGWLQYAKETGAPTFITARKYTVVQNDTPIGIAKRMNAFVNRPQWWSELKAANPHKPTQSGTGNWVSLYPNEEIGIPDAWPETSLAVAVSEMPVPGNQYEPAGLPAPGKTTTLDPGVVPHAQALLVKWAYQNPNECNPSDYGRNPMDLLGGITTRTTQALSSFQTWWNKKQPTRPLNSAGELDTETYHALVEADNASNSPATNQQSPSTPQQQPSNTTPSTNVPKAPPEWWPKEIPWPFPSQQQSQQQPQPPAQQSPTPQQPAPQPAPSSNAQPAPTNGAPYGWPKEWPWPPVPVTNATQQQPSQPPNSSSNAQPAPTNGAPPGWPKEWPWPLWSQTNATPEQPKPTPQPQPEQPAPNNNNTPSAPTNGAPPGWPKEWPWPLPSPSLPPPQLPVPAPTPAPAPTPTPNPSTNESPPVPMGPPADWPKDWPWSPVTPSPSPSGGTTQLDSNLDPKEKDEILGLLAHGDDADQMDRLAIGYAKDGYPLTALALHRRAVQLRAQSQANEPPIVFVQNPEASNAEGGGGSLLPALAILGAGFVLS